MSDQKFVFAAYADSEEGLKEIDRLTKSLRTFGGRFRKCPVWACIPEDFNIDNLLTGDEFGSLKIEIRRSHTPAKAKWFYYAGKVYAAAEAEVAAQANEAVLVWMDNDTIIMSEPNEFDLAPCVCLAYKPVMHNRSGSACNQPPDPFWSRIYKQLSVSDDQLFEMTTPADQQKIRAYFQAGILVVRPEQKILSRWTKDFETLYQDPVLTEMCKSDDTRRVFLHQTALVGSILNHLDRDQMRELSDRYNYPLFFEKQYDAAAPFNSIEDVTTLRCVVSTEKMGADWHNDIEGPAEKILWLKEHL